MKEKILLSVPKELKEFVKQRATEEYTTMTQYIITLIKKDKDRCMTKTP